MHLPLPPLPEADAARLWWLHVHETPVQPPWSEDDARWASDAARRQVGERADAVALLTERGRLGSQRLAERGAAMPRTAPPWRWVAALVGAAALLLGWGTEAVASGRHINILAPPLLALLVWNLAVYLVLGLQALRGGAPAAVRRLGAWSQRWGRPAAGAAAPAARFAIGWARASQPLHTARVAALMHTAAALWALGALASLYARALAFEYRAGWESTFLSADAVHGLLSLLLGPASVVSGIALPTVTELQALRLPEGGENAARWIHLHAITLLGVVVLPRALMAAWALWRARRRAQAVPLPVDPRMARLLQVQGGQQVPVQVWSFSYRLGPQRDQALRERLRETFGEVLLSLAETEGDDGRLDPPPPGTAVIALFALTATPERETHGAWLQRLRQAAPSARVWIDESGFRERFPGAAGEQRLAQRRAAWQRLVTDEGLKAEFVRLAIAQPTTA